MRMRCLPSYISGYLEKRKLCLQLVKRTRISSRLHADRIQTGHAVEFDERYCGMVDKNNRKKERKVSDMGRFADMLLRVGNFSSVASLSSLQSINLDVDVNVNISNVKRDWKNKILTRRYNFYIRH